MSPRSIFLFLSLNLLLSSTNSRQTPATRLTPVKNSCPLNFTTLGNLLTKEPILKPSNTLSFNCECIKDGIQLVLSEYFRTTGSFFPPGDSAESCWDSAESLVDSYLPGLRIRASCGIKTSWISDGCMNISTPAQFEKAVDQSALEDAGSKCRGSLLNEDACASCKKVVRVMQTSLCDTATGVNVFDCTDLPSIYVGGLVNDLGPADPGTSRCLFSQYPLSRKTTRSRNKVVFLVVVVVSVVVLVGSGFLLYYKRNWKNEPKKKHRRVMPESGSSAMRFTFEQIKEATKNFHRENLIGRGGYGNVYVARLSDGSEFAVKRFKNCSASGDADFTHEVESLASIRHVNLVDLRGYCVATTSLEGHQRFIVCDLMKNGSLHDHLFRKNSNLSWPTRQKIALGIARGLAYLHYGAQPTIIHRDIKASNILLDDEFEPKVADFGLAKGYPDGRSHLSTRVAGTMGYVAPEYAVYGQLTERTDVYSFGVVLLELLSGKKAVLSVNEEGQPSLLTDWAWGLVTKGDVLGVVEQGMPEIGSNEVMEKYVYLAVVCSHPQLYGRPTMDQVVKILETDLVVPWVPKMDKRSVVFPLIAELEDTESSTSISDGSD